MKKFQLTIQERRIPPQFLWQVQELRNRPQELNEQLSFYQYNTYLTGKFVYFLLKRILFCRHSVLIGLILAKLVHLRVIFGGLSWYKQIMIGSPHTCFPPIPFNVLRYLNIVKYSLNTSIIFLSPGGSITTSYFFSRTCLCSRCAIACNKNL